MYSSKLKQCLKPVVEFDPTNAEHRLAVKNFLDSNSWRGCPVTFKAPHYGNTLGYIQRVMLEYYTSNEFKV